jgi:hypothetical protein
MKLLLSQERIALASFAAAWDTTEPQMPIPDTDPFHPSPVNGSQGSLSPRPRSQIHTRSVRRHSTEASTGIVLGEKEERELQAPLFKHRPLLRIKLLMEKRTVSLFLASF